MELTATQKRVATWVALALLIVFALRALGPVLTPFLVAAVFAYVLAPLVDRLCELAGGRFPRPLAAVIVELLFVLALVLLVLLIAPVVSKELPQVREQLPVVHDKLAVARACGIDAIVAGRVEAGPKQLVVEPLAITFGDDALQLR